MSEENKAIVRRIAEEGWNQRQYEKIDEFFTADYVNFDPGNPDTKNLEQYKQWLAEIHTSCADHHITIDDMIAEGNKVTKQWSLKATFTKEYKGIPPTNKELNMSGITIYNVVGGKVKECIWGYDVYGMLVQMGVIPSE